MRDSAVNVFQFHYYKNSFPSLGLVSEGPFALSLLPKVFHMLSKGTLFRLSFVVINVNEKKQVIKIDIGRDKRRTH